MNLSMAYSILERYLNYLMDCYNDGNYADYSVDVQITKNKLEKIIMHQPNLSIEDKDFLRELFDDGDLGESVAEAIDYILGEYENA